MPTQQRHQARPLWPHFITAIAYSKSEIYFFLLFRGNVFASCLSSQVHRCLGARALAEQLLQATEAKAKQECSKEKGFWKLKDKCVA